MDNSLTPIEVDLSDVNSFEPVPPDVYQVAVVSVKNQRRSAKNPDNICWDLVFRIIEGEYAKRTIYHTLVYGPSCGGFMAAFLDSFGLSTGDRVFTVDPTLWNGQIGHVETTNEEYEGKIRTKIKSFVVRK